MAEIVSEVYDVVYPSPVSLQEIVSIAVAVQKWHSELKRYGLSELEEFHAEGNPDQDISLLDVISNLPSTINHIINEYHKVLVPSINAWLKFNFYFIFKLHRENYAAILKDFNDIACNFNGTLHYDRTAKRMMQCDRISQEEKFNIACVYCFEDDIRRIWPSIESDMDLNKITFDQCPHLYYWVCCIKNEMDKIQIRDEGYNSIEERMLDYDTGSRSAFEYFWNRISLERQSEMALDFCCRGTPMGFYSKFILPKLNKQQKVQYLDSQYTFDWFHEMMTNDKGSREYILPIWMCIKNNMKETTFVNLARKLIFIESDLYIADGSTEQAFRNDEILTLCCDIWISAADNLKRAAIKYLFEDDPLLETEWNYFHHREIRFIMAVLSDATIKERIIFWNNKWLDLLKSTHRTNFLKVMKFCLNEEQIRRFQETNMSKYGNIKEAIVFYFQAGYFQELENFVNFCCPNQNSRRALYRRMLQPDFFKIYDILNENNICKAKLMREFIDDVYSDDPELSTDFKNNFLSSLLHKSIRIFNCCYLHEVSEFVDVFSSYSQNLDQIKKGYFVEKLRRFIIGDLMHTFHGEEVREFLFWCLGKEDENELIKFKQSISPDQVVRNMVDRDRRIREDEIDPVSDGDMIEYPQALDHFLSWYFASPEEIDEFKTRLTDVF